MKSLIVTKMAGPIREANVSQVNNYLVVTQPASIDLLEEVIRRDQMRKIANGSVKQGESAARANGIAIAWQLGIETRSRLVLSGADLRARIHRTGASFRPTFGTRT